MISSCHDWKYICNKIHVLGYFTVKKLFMYLDTGALCNKINSVAL